ncbi:hypothetical protein ACLB2K_003409 [Fragaria x ananassa]
MKLMHKTPQDVDIYHWRLFGSHLSIASIYNVQCQGVECLWLTNDVGLLLLAFLYKSVLTTASTRTLRFHVSAFSVVVGDYTSKRATIATLWVAKSCYAELVKGFSIPPALYHKHHRGRALSFPQQIAQLTPISRPTYRQTLPFVLETLIVETYVMILKRRLVYAIFSWANFLFLTCLRPEDMPYLKRGGMLGLLSTIPY